MDDSSQTLLAQRIDDTLVRKSLGGDLNCECLGDLAEIQVGVDSEADSATDVSYTEGNGGYCCDELVGTGYLRNDGTGDDDATNANRSNSYKSVHSVEVVGSRDTNCTRAGGHHGGEEDHQSADAALGDGNKD